MDIKNYSISQLNELSSKIRKRILDVVSKNGGHLSSTLGATELIIAMHYVFDAQKDPFIFDVSHQAYAHKLLTDRWDSFETLRTFDGISGFTKPSESDYDYFISGHSSTSISLGVGAARAIALKNEDRLPIAFIGDGSMSAGMVYEALNELGDKKFPMVIILNDNEMSIAKPIGAVSKYLSEILAGKFYQNLKTRVQKGLEYLPNSATYMAKKFDESLKLITPGILFEELGIDYIGPVDGHNIETLIKTFKIAKELKKPVIIHAQTLKGKGYEKAEGYLENWHGVGPFEIESGQSKKKSTSKSATQIFSEKLLDFAKNNKNIIGVTAAMPSGTGMRELMDYDNERFFDVGIAEQHAVTSVAALAKEGFKPFIAIYSTFLQRAYDQIIHDVAIMSLPVVFAVDRAGIVGEDGETHQGAFDISFFRTVPNMVLFAPRDEKTLENAIEFSSTLDKPCAFRYPRGSFETNNYEFVPFELGKGQILKKGQSDIVFLAYGDAVAKASKVIEILDLDITLVDLRFVKPLDEELLISLAKESKNWFVFSNSIKIGGVGSAILEFLSNNRINCISVISFEFDDEFIKHGKKELVEESIGISAQQLSQKVKSFIEDEARL
jgi:1-deoxy-D-xylulose-5-phosphate synthase